MQSVERNIHEADFCIICQQLIKTQTEARRRMHVECGAIDSFLSAVFYNKYIQSLGFINH